MDLAECFSKICLRWLFKMMNFTRRLLLEFLLRQKTLRNRKGGFCQCYMVIYNLEVTGKTLLRWFNDNFFEWQFNFYVKKQIKKCILCLDLHHQLILNEGDFNEFLHNLSLFALVQLFHRQKINARKTFYLHYRNAWHHQR